MNADNGDAVVIGASSVEQLTQNLDIIEAGSQHAEMHERS